MNPETRGPRRSLRRIGNKGQVLLFFLIFLLPMTMMVLSVYNIGMAVSQKMKLQNAADNAAYSAAVWEARYLNQMAYINRAMVANYDTMATITALWSMIDSFDGAYSLLRTLLKPLVVIPVVGQIIDNILGVIHQVIGNVNKIIAQQIVGGKAFTSKMRLVGALEGYNTALSYTQPVLYALNQIGRQKVIESIAWGVDSGAQYSSLAEIYNAYALHRRRQWEGTDRDTGLRMTIERSLNEFSNGDSIRDLKSFLPGGLSDVIGFFEGLPCPIPGGSWGIEIGPHGFNGPGFDHVSGLPTTASGEGEGGTVIIQDPRIYQHDFFGFGIRFCVSSLELGHHSDDDYNIGGTKAGVGLILPHIADVLDSGTQHHYDNFSKNDIQCSPIAITGALSQLDSKVSMLNSKINECEDIAKHNAEHPDDQRSDTVFIPNGKTDPITHQPLGERKKCSELGSIMDGLDSENMPIPCVTSYTFKTPLHKMKVTTYVADEDAEKAGLAQGPTVLVYLREKKEHTLLFTGLHLDPWSSGLNWNLEAYAFSKAYSAERVPPNWFSMQVQEWKASGANWLYSKQKLKLDTQSGETAFNPFWAGRLELPSLFTIGFPSIPGAGAASVAGVNVPKGTSVDPLLH